MHTGKYHSNFLWHNLQLVEHGQYLVEVEEVGFPNKIKAAMTVLQWSNSETDIPMLINVWESCPKLL
jgi:hypothetical protein